MAKNQVEYYCIFCGNKVDKNGRIQFNQDGNVIGCCRYCLEYAELFVKEGRKVKPKEV